MAANLLQKPSGGGDGASSNKCNRLVECVGPRGMKKLIDLKCRKA